MILTINADCNVITATPETAYLTNIQNGVSTACCTYLDLGINCCATSQLCLRNLYTLDYSVTGCGTEVVNAVTYNYFDVTYTGIDISCVAEIEYNSFITSSTVIETSPTDLVVRYHYASKVPLDITLIIRTYTDLCLEYSVQGIIEITDYLIPCGTVIDSGPTPVYPALTAGVTISGTDFLITAEAYGQTSSTFADGVYYVGLVQDNVPESDSIFADCDVQCKVIDYVSKDPCSNLYAVYQSLIYAGACTTISYTQMCSIWTYIGLKLGYFKSSPCAEVSDCGCN